MTRQTLRVLLLGLIAGGAFPSAASAQCLDSNVQFQETDRKVSMDGHTFSISAVVKGGCYVVTVTAEGEGWCGALDIIPVRNDPTLATMPPAGTTPIICAPATGIWFFGLGPYSAMEVHHLNYGPRSMTDRAPSELVLRGGYVLTLDQKAAAHEAREARDDAAHARDKGDARGAETAADRAERAASQSGGNRDAYKDAQEAREAAQEARDKKPR